MIRSASVDMGVGRLSLTRGVFVRLLGLVHLIAFGSLWVQIDGLVSSRGILPVAPWLERVDAVVDGAAWLRAPTLLWLAPDDAMLHLLCAVGVLCAIAVMAGVATFWTLAILWVSYLSLAIAGQTFLQFQWDSLLLETTVCALFLVPFYWRPGERLARRAPDPRVGIWLLRALVFKLMFLSGAVKLLSLDHTWLDGVALEYHYWTQPLPLGTSWWAYHLPAQAHRVSSWAMLAIELLVPILIFTPRRARVLAGAVLICFQALIAATGNYGFFNLLTAVLCVSLVDDGALLRLARRRSGGARAGAPAPAMPSTLRWVLAALVLVISFVTFVRELVYTVPRDELQPDSAWAPAVLDTAQRLVLDPTSALMERVDPFRSISGYGLFRVMTTSRQEIAVEASDDGVTWRELAFRFKPGDPARRPRWATPHMPRLDWQMWFAALAPRQAGWLAPLTTRLLEGEPAVWRLLGGEVPENGPPAYLRLVLWDYRFTTPAERHESGAWWHRERVGELTGPLRRDGAELAYRSPERTNGAGHLVGVGSSRFRSATWPARAVAGRRNRRAALAGIDVVPRPREPSTPPPERGRQGNQRLSRCVQRQFVTVNATFDGEEQEDALAVVDRRPSAHGSVHGNDPRSKMVSKVAPGSLK